MAMNVDLVSNLPVQENVEYIKTRLHLKSVPRDDHHLDEMDWAQWEQNYWNWHRNPAEVL